MQDETENKRKRLAAVIDLVEEGIIEKHDAPAVVIRRCHFIFDTHDQEKIRSEYGIIAYEPSTSQRTFSYAIPSMSTLADSPVTLLMQAIHSGNNEFRSMIRRAYEKKAPVLVGEEWVGFEEYESAFSGFSFYEERRIEDEARVVDHWGRRIVEKEPKA